MPGVGPTDLKIRRGDVKGTFQLPEPPVLGLETAGTVDAVGGGVDGVAVGDEVATLLPSRGGYGEYALAAAWTHKPPQVTWSDAGALPVSVEAAVGVLRQLDVTGGETLLILGAGGSVGIVATQLALRQGLRVIGAVGTRDEALARELGPTPVPYGNELASGVRAVADRGRREPSTLRAKAASRTRSRLPAAPTGWSRLLTNAQPSSAFASRSARPTGLLTRSTSACSSSPPVSCDFARSGPYRCHRPPKPTACWR